MNLREAKIGIVSEVDESKFLAKVTLPADNFVTDWLYIQKLNGSYALPVVNETVIVWLDEDWNRGVIVGSIYTNSMPAPYSDKNIVGFKLQNFEMKIDISTGEVNISTGEIIMEADNITMNTEKLIVSGTVEVGKDIKADGKIDATGVIKSVSDLQTSTFKANTHTHPTAAPGSPTGPPIPS